MGAAPGWYEDREHPGWLRWWDGTGWTEQRTPAPQPQHPMQAPIAPTTAVPVTPAPMTATPARRGRAALIAFVVVLVTAAVVAVIGSRLAESGEDDAAGTPASEQDASGEASEDASDAAESAPPIGDRVIGSCDEASPLTVPGTDISIDPLSRGQEAEIGESVVEEVLSTSVVADDPATQALLEGLLAEVRPRDDGVDYRVTLLESEEVNAFAVPGGSVFFTTAITDLMTADELAFVMGHEVAHVHCRHSAQQIERVGLAAATANAILGTDLDAEDIYADAAGSALADLASLSFSRDDELEADLASLDLLEGAGRPLSAGGDALRKLQSLEGTYEPSQIEVLLSIHPPTQERIDAVDAAAG